MKLRYHIYLLEEYSTVDIIKIQEFIEEYLKMNSVEDVSNQISEGKIIYYAHLETKIFEELASKVLNQFDYELSEYTIFIHNHCHIDRYNDNNHIIHSVTAYQISETVWEFYYEDGILDVPKNTGTVEGQTCYLYKLEIESSKDNLTNTLEKSFDDWLNTLA
ncbi:hypothetical protein ACIQ1H_16580 [Lysinibacillus sp. NPDC097279]|uniref:hypothetical protein n=1 Tax=Lysinibacillus sp. NPDC097279 TaxID=3364143 RepID=UPI0038065267